MPELPEVQTVSSDLKKYLLGFTFEKVEIEPGYKALPDNETFKKKLVGQKIIRIYRIAKNIVIELASEDSLVFHLAMTGQVLLSDPKTRKFSHERVTFVLDNGKKSLGLKFRDVRMFGKVVVVTKSEIEAMQNRYGPEPINPDLTAEEFLAQIKSKRSSIKNVLLDQEIISGLGNIYATDALFMAKIHPQTSTSLISLKQAEKLLQTAKEILLEGIEHRGSTLEDKGFVDALGKYGTHQNYFRIYNKTTCAVCNSKVCVIKINGRSTYFCPSCQPEGNQPTLL
ncbi:MAG TPA: bifunctional DNA-formamidopyrimidine glycosylase/DNA-(apurinic or apyrimidinic site) lyase [Candidatus Saccharimonadales bacterium]|nr:bifunctional DNA-formamidopyrimidine glycosylase/DNA-(apurinic or apyrimidinic site) lyase [Candidatus Saccharimonadales bacterium]